MVLHSRVIESLNVMSIAKNVMSFLGKMMKSWRVTPNCSAGALREVPTKREIFQGDKLSPLLVVFAIIAPTHMC